MGGLRVVRVRTARALKQFIEFSYALRGVEPLWVPPLRRDVRMLLDRDRHPFHRHGEMDCFLALRDGVVVGRIAMIENHAHNIAHQERAAHFGFFEAENDERVFRALYTVAGHWARRRGLNILRGPCSPSTNEECGFLAEGFDVEPTVMTPYTPMYYLRHTEACGFAKAKDLLNYHMNKETFSGRIAEMATRLEEKLTKRGINYRIRTLDMKEFPREVERIRVVYNAAWQKNWGFVPMTDAELRHLANELKPVVDPSLVLFAEVDGEPAGLLLGLPDFNVVLRHLGGNLGPRELLLAMLLKKSIHRVRLLVLGVREEFRNRGLETILIAKFAENCLARGIPEGELGWVLEDNRLMNRQILAIGGRVNRVLRLYEKPITEARAAT